MSFNCSVCNKSFTQQKNLKRHKKNIHNLTDDLSYSFSTFNNKCVDGCDCSFKTLKDLRSHLNNIHNFKFEEETFEFKNFEDFNIWLENCNRNKNYQYLLSKRRSKNNEDCEIFYYYCNRSGNYCFNANDRKRKRALKSQGSCKLNRACTSSITMRQNAVSGKCFVQFFKTHYRHSVELQHIRIPKVDRINIAHKLSAGITITRVLDDNRRNIDSDTLIRRDLLTRKDINNIKQSFKIDVLDGVHHENDAVSVDIWVEEYQKTSFVYYKKQGDDHAVLDTQDFCLIFMNASQEHLLKTFGNHIVCIDSTHGLNSYDFDLTTIMIIDEFGEGLPGACMFSNRKDVVINELFFTKIKERVGILSPVTFMTDITPVFYNAWKTVMGPVQNQLYCSWHVDRAWKSNLNKINNLEKRQNVYKTLKYLQYILDENKFVSEIQSTIKLLCNDEETKQFGDYFQKNYLNNFRQWSYAFRKNCGINTNMRLESMHKIVKYYYLDAKKTKRLDKGIHSITSYIRNKIIERIIKSTKGKHCSHISEIDKRHSVSENSTFDVSLSNNVWFLKSKTNTHSVIKMQNEACCKLTCSFCKICVHTYRCTCVDYYIKSTICKHIHYIVTKEHKENAQLNTHNNVVAGVSSNVNEVINEETKIHLKTIGTSTDIYNSINLSTINDIKDMCNKIRDHNFENISESDLLYVKKSLTTVCSFLYKSNDTFGFGAGENYTPEPSNKKIVKQKTFHSTKKFTKSAKKPYTKPTLNERINIENCLLNKPFVSTESSNDHDYYQKIDFSHAPS